MSYGYTTRIDSLNQKADQSLLGVRLGRVCIDNDVSVTEMASQFCLLYTSPSPRDRTRSRMPSSA